VTVILVSGLRFTAGLVRTAQGWRFAQMHPSTPDGGAKRRQFVLANSRGIKPGL